MTSAESAQSKQWFFDFKIDFPRHVSWVYHDRSYPGFIYLEHTGTSRTTQVDPGRPRRIRYMQAHSTPHKQSFFPSSYFPLSFRFTSIGNRSNTEPNPALSYYDPVTSELKFMPAYALTNGDEERRGRL